MRSEKPRVIPHALTDGARALFSFGAINSHCWAILTHFSTLFKNGLQAAGCQNDTYDDP